MAKLEDYEILRVLPQLRSMILLFIRDALVLIFLFYAERLQGRGGKGRDGERMMLARFS